MALRFAGKLLGVNQDDRTFTVKDNEVSENKGEETEGVVNFGNKLTGKANFEVTGNKVSKNSGKKTVGVSNFGNR
ncbi:hypothetical protein L3X38_043889 [Prunus dulcis]|uniref:Uncharacterized protein n=1 Tax=Prunus dulcis TaxID=3755 RepID=A0AAD4UYM6_PRUDU|nr:hypothetical protein L3X38_043889 [Prunus dulcis]